MTSVTLPDFAENIEEGYIVVNNNFIDANAIVSMHKDQERERLSIRFVNGYTDLEGEEAVNFIHKFNSFLVSI
jgi:Ethanolamine utilization protein EutJ (predicted chaperonin)